MCPLLDPISVSLEDPHRTTRHALSSFVVVPPLGLPPTLTAAEVSRRSQCSWSRGNLGATLRVAGEQPAKTAENPFADTFFPTLFFLESQAPKPSPGPHKTRECLPLILILRNRLKYALTGREAKAILMERYVKVDGKVRTDVTYPTGFMDVISLEKSDEYFRILYDSKGRMTVHRISAEEASYKLCKVKDIKLGEKAIPTLTTHDGRTLRYPDPLVKINDSILFDIESGKMKDFIRFDNGNVAMITGGHNAGRVGVILNREKHKGSNDIVHLKDAAGNTFATRIQNVFVIGKGNKPLVSLAKGKGIKLTILQEQQQKYDE